MSGKWSNILKKLNRYFFGEPSDDGNDREEQVEDSKKKLERQAVNAGRTPGAKVVHRYPSGGNFRFPMDLEKTPPRRQPQRSREPVNVKSKNNEPKSPQKEQKKEYFTNPDFKLTHTPSPVHGFQKPPETRNFAHEPEIETEETEIAVTEQVLTSPSRDNDSERVDDLEDKGKATEHQPAEHDLNLRGVSERSNQRLYRSTTPSHGTATNVHESSNERREQEISKRSAKRREVTSRETRKPSGDASNVIMTPTDRYHYEKRRRQKKRKGPFRKTDHDQPKL
ncbi:hypothetical protein [Salicibibacter kimchii]|uniref:Uncharacterized protein n=1 Tax=Salicibibacter kimchii TaxID=2099786 RepID=A0A345BYH0_9BACI|nr:hypothetical protein [Salicibibacter kimchii]AXF56001.1 hypothetical protein DT065_08155 [Salicibibacter kimchii]